MSWVLDNWELIGERMWVHLVTSLPAIVAAVLISLPLGWLAHRIRPLNSGILTTAGLLYAIPSLPLFIALPIMLGTGLRDLSNVVLALTLYGIALMVRSVTDGFDAVPTESRLAAVAMGYSGLRRILTVELPLAVPVMITGLRVVSVSTISLCTVGAVLGIPSLGMLFTDGFQRSILSELVAGIVLTMALAAVLDVLIVALGKALTPWRRQAVV